MYLGKEKREKNSNRKEMNTKQSSVSFYLEKEIEESLSLPFSSL